MVCEEIVLKLSVGDAFWTGFWLGLGFAAASSLIAFLWLLLTALAER